MKLMIQNARLSFCNIFTPRSHSEGQVEKFDVTLICSDETTVKLLGAENKGKPAVGHELLGSQIIPKVIKDKFGKLVKVKNWAYNPADGSGTRDAYTDNEGEYYSGIDEDSFLISANKKPGQIQRTKNNDAGQLLVLNQSKRPAEAGDLASGDYVNVIIDVYACDIPGVGKIVSAALEGVQLIKEGERFGGASVVDGDDFEELETANEFDEDAI